jgi:hypothetical protein
MAESALNLITLPIGELADAIRHCRRALVNLFVVGPPGCGKTQIAKQVAKADGIQYSELLLAGRDVGDVFMPYVDGDNGLTFHYNPNIPIVGNPGFNHEIETLLNIDEVTGANRLMQNILLKATDERLIGEAKLQPKVSIMATGNRAWDLANVEQLSAALGNRATFITVEPDLDAFLAYGTKNNFHPLVLAWVKFDPQYLYRFDSEQYLAGDHAFCSPRSNERLSQILWERENHGMSDSIFRALACGTIGAAIGVKFVGFCEMEKDLPDIAALLAGASQHHPSNPSVIYATIYSIVQRVTEANLQHALAYVEGFKREWGQMFVSSFVQAKPDLIATPEWGQFVSNNANFVANRV